MFKQRGRSRLCLLTLVAGGDHLRDVQHKRTVGVAVLDGNASLIFGRTRVQSLGAVLLGIDGRRQVVDNHLQQRLGGWQPGGHDSLQEGLALQLPGLLGKVNVQLLEHVEGDVQLVVHDSVEQSVDGTADELAEGTLQLLALSVDHVLGEFLGVGIEEPVTPQALHHLLDGNTELGGIHLGEARDGETPRMQTGAEADSALLRVDLPDSQSTMCRRK